MTATRDVALPARRALDEEFEAHVAAERASGDPARARDADLLHKIRHHRLFGSLITLIKTGHPDLGEPWGKRFVDDMGMPRVDKTALLGDLTSVSRRPTGGEPSARVRVTRLAMILVDSLRVRDDDREHAVRQAVLLAEAYADEARPRRPRPEGSPGHRVAP